MKKEVCEILEEQCVVGFTGKVNFMREGNSELLGHLLFLNGEIVNAVIGSLNSYKALMSLLAKAELTSDVKLVVEPELVPMTKKKLDFPLEVIKRKLDQYLELYKESVLKRPSDELNLVIRPEFLESDEDVTPEEFELLTTISDYSLVKDIYIQNKMLDHDITNSLVQLRQKNALKVVETKMEQNKE